MSAEQEELGARMVWVWRLHWGFPWLKVNIAVETLASEWASKRRAIEAQVHQYEQYGAMRQWLMEFVDWNGIQAKRRVVAYWQHDGVADEAVGLMSPVNHEGSDSDEWEEALEVQAVVELQDEKQREQEGDDPLPVAHPSEEAKASLPPQVAEYALVLYRRPIGENQPEEEDTRYEDEEDKTQEGKIHEEREALTQEHRGVRAVLSQASRLVVNGVTEWWHRGRDVEKELALAVLRGWVNPEDVGEGKRLMEVYSADEGAAALRVIAEYKGTAKNQQLFWVQQLLMGARCHHGLGLGDATRCIRKAREELVLQIHADKRGQAPARSQASEQAARVETQQSFEPDLHDFTRAYDFVRSKRLYELVSSSKAYEWVLLACYLHLYRGQLFQDEVVDIAVVIRANDATLERLRKETERERQEKERERQEKEYWREQSRAKEEHHKQIEAENAALREEIERFKAAQQSHRGGADEQQVRGDGSPAATYGVGFFDRGSHQAASDEYSISPQHEGSEKNDTQAEPGTS